MMKANTLDEFLSFVYLDLDNIFKLFLVMHMLLCS